MYPIVFFFLPISKKAIPPDFSQVFQWRFQKNEKFLKKPKKWTRKIRKAPFLPSFIPLKSTNC